ncbi:DinB family protein [Flavobacterium sp.]|uniref:DinB family protein n=1 Tax=Flavobacterium sp. TaxID=239 RepID=UPI002FDEDD14
MRTFYLDKFQYNLDKNQQMIQYLVEHQKELNEKIHILVSHILNAHEIWNTRILKVPTQFGVWQLQNWEQMMNIDKNNHEVSVSILESKELDVIVDYVTSTGENYSNSIQDLLFHVINHSNYHRAQINSELKSLGLKPLITDYVFYKRK